MNTLSPDHLVAILDVVLAADEWIAADEDDMPRRYEDERRLWEAVVTASRTGAITAAREAKDALGAGRGAVGEGA